jgi:ADP-ribose pyrophosphatase YjhB (NUDIX family)
LARDHAGGRSTSLRTPRIAAGALFIDDAERVLLVQPAYKAHWDIPGGYVEPGESPLVACQREVQEELGFEPDLGPLLVVDWAPNEGEGDKILFVYDGGGMTSDDAKDRLQLNTGELTDWAFYHPYEASSLLTPRLARRLTVAVEARRTGQFVYAEHGKPLRTLPNSAH